MRNLCSAQIPCSGGCKYCFAKWNDIYVGQPSLETAIIDDNFTILYPCCDGEFFDQHEIISAVKEVSNTAKKVYISVSTKRKLQRSELNNILSLNQWLTETGKGFVKFSVSISTKSKLNEIEPSTMTYNERLLLAEKLKLSEIWSSLTLKPILPFITVQEYIEIIRDFKPYVNDIAIGGLYVNPTSAFYKDYIQNIYVCDKRQVCWLNDRPEWFYIEDTEKMEQIKLFASQHNMHVHDSDEALIKSMILRMG